MTNLLTDNRGTELEIGQTVVFNFSGEMGIGTIIKLDTRPSRRYDSMSETITIERTFPSGWSSNKISKVKSSKNVMVIFESAGKAGDEKKSALDSLIS
jgi:hypothetical protein